MEGSFPTKSTIKLRRSFFCCSLNMICLQETQDAVYAEAFCLQHENMFVLCVMSDEEKAGRIITGGVEHAISVWLFRNCRILRNTKCPLWQDSCHPLISTR